MTKNTLSATSNPKSKTSTPQSLRVLIVEDSEDDVLLIIRELKKGGYNPVYERVETAAAMKKALQEKQWDIILCDYKLPKFSGTKAISLLKEINIDIPLLIISGKIGEEAALECMRLGAQDYLMKDNLSRLCLAIARELEEAATRSKRKQTEDALRESEEKYRTILENIEDGYYEVDLNGNFTFFNASMCRILGYPQEEMMGMNNRKFTDKENAKKLFKTFNEVYRKGQPAKEFGWQIIRKDGTKRYIEVSVSLQKNSSGKPIGFRGISRDVTSRKQAEAALRESEEKYRLVVENAKEAIIIAQDVKLVFVNRAAIDMIGYSGDISTAKSFIDFIHPDDRNIVVDYHIRRVKGEEVPLVYSFRILSQDGTVKWVEFNTAVIQWKGRPATLSFLNDITERKQAEDALRRSEEKYRFMTDNVADIIWTVDMNLNFTYISPSVQRFRGLTVEEAMSQKIDEVLTPASLQYAFKVLEEELKTLMGNPDRIRDKLTVELEEYCKDGSTIWTENELKYLPDQDGKPIGIIGVSRDISARKQAEKALRESEEFFKEITENSSDIIIITDKNGDIKYCSRSIERLSGYKSEELIGKSGFTFIHPDDIERAVDDYGKAILTPDTAIPNEFRLVRKDGSTRYFDGLGKNLLDNPAVAGFIMNIRDITERKQAEEEKRKLEERLQRAHKMEAIGTLAGGIAHDFNNLLMGIQGYASLALLNINQNDPNYEKLKRIEQQVQSGADLTRQLLGFARGGRYEVKPAYMNDIIEKSSSIFGSVKKEITINKKYEKNLYPVEVDLGQMEQVFMNLYVNAWQAMPGGGNIYLETENVFLNDEQALSYSVKPGKYVKITVTDTGTGVDEKTRERIFDPFFTTKAMGRGTGLGLATVYGIIKGHKGMINVYSEPGHGTTFTIYLPASEKEVVKEETATGTIDTGTETILLVDDEKIVLEVSRELLESMGYRVYAVGSGQEAIALFMGKRNEIDLVILDMIMPEISGGETFDRLREINPGIKVLLSSGYSINGEAQTIMNRGCKGFIQKPFQLEKLSHKVREMLD